MIMRIPSRKPRWTDAQLAAWTSNHPVGTAVRYWGVRGRDEHLDTTISSEPWRLGPGGPPVVKIEGLTGGVSLDHLKKIPRT